MAPLLIHVHSSGAWDKEKQHSMTAGSCKPAQLPATSPAPWPPSPSRPAKVRFCRLCFTTAAKATSTTKGNWATGGPAAVRAYQAPSSCQLITKGLPSWHNCLLLEVGDGQLCECLKLNTWTVEAKRHNFSTVLSSFLSFSLAPFLLFFFLPSS